MAEPYKAPAKALKADESVKKHARCATWTRRWRRSWPSGQIAGLPHTVWLKRTGHLPSIRAADEGRDRGVAEGEHEARAGSGESEALKKKLGERLPHEACWVYRGASVKVYADKQADAQPGR